MADNYKKLQTDTLGPKEGRKTITNMKDFANLRI